MGQTPTISVLIPVYNAGPYLGKCLDSLICQSWSDFEVIAVDDGSVDNSADICAEYVRRDGRIRWLRQSNQGVAAARNTCLGQARGEYLTFVDSDDWVEPRYLEQLWEACRRYQVPLSACNHWIEGRNGGRPCFSPGRSQELNARQACENVLYHRPPDVSPWGKLYSRTLMEQIRYPEGKYYEDTFRIAEILIQAGRMAYLSQPLYHYRIHRESISRGSFQPSKLQFIEAVEHMTETMKDQFPNLEKGVIRRRVHAALSVRRYLVDCPPTERAYREELEKEVRRWAGRVLGDAQAPLRDKIGVCSVLAGPRAYDFFWRCYKRYLRPD